MVTDSETIDSTYAIVQTLYCFGWSIMFYFFVWQNAVRVRNNSSFINLNVNARTAVQILGLFSTFLSVFSWLTVFNLIDVIPPFRFMVINAVNYVLFMLAHLLLFYVEFHAFQRIANLSINYFYITFGTIFLFNLTICVVSFLAAILGKQTWPIYLYLASYSASELIIGLSFILTTRKVQQTITSSQMRSKFKSFNILITGFNVFVLVQVIALVLYCSVSPSFQFTKFMEPIDLTVFSWRNQWPYLVEQLVYFTLWALLLWYFWRPLSLFFVPDVLKYRKIDKTFN